MKNLKEYLIGKEITPTFGYDSYYITDIAITRDGMIEVSYINDTDDAEVPESMYLHSALITQYLDAPFSGVPNRLIDGRYVLAQEGWSLQGSVLRLYDLNTDSFSSGNYYTLEKEGLFAEDDSDY